MGYDNRNDIKVLGVVVAAVLVLGAILAAVLLPWGQTLTAALGQGLGLKAAVLWGFATTIGLFIVFALVAGDGLLGELQFMLGSFFLFFVVISLLIAWVF